MKKVRIKKIRIEMVALILSHIMYIFILLFKLSARGFSYDEIDQFNVDRPFVFVISDRTTESNLFMGVINDPRV